jgi:hypothetical protein
MADEEPKKSRERSLEAEVQALRHTSSVTCALQMWRGFLRVDQRDDLFDVPRCANAILSDERQRAISMTGRSQSHSSSKVRSQSAASPRARSAK